MPLRASNISWTVPFGTVAAPPVQAEAPLHVSSASPTVWLHEHVAALWRIVARLGVPAHHVDDVLQETWITAARRSADIGPGRERAFLIATATRLCSNYRQRAHVRREVSQGEALDEHASHEPDAEQLLVRKRLRERLERALASLSDAHRTVFVLYELEGLSVPELAELLELPLGTAASRLGRARAKFAEAAARQQRVDGPLEET
jgi:RNA polymerase sigma-70 factor, ECF subfamily